jgi:hypothetical protein
MGRGIGYIDMHLLASVLLANGIALCTRKRRLDNVAGDLSVAYAPSL